MKLNKTQLRIIELITNEIEVFPREISKRLGVSSSLVSKNLSYLIKLGFLEKIKKKARVSSNKFARTLSNLLMEDKTLIKDLANESVPILMVIIEKDEVNIEGISRETELSISSIYPYIKRFLKREIVYKKEDKISFNKKVWRELHQFITSYKSHYILSQFKDVPNNAKIYYESLKGIVFSLNNEFELAAKTAFSLYEKYGIKLMEKEIFYRLPKKKLNIQTVFLDSLRVAGNTESARQRAYCYLFYKKNISSLRKVSHPDLDILKGIVKGSVDKYPNFPTKQEIIEKCQDYDIRI